MELPLRLAGALWGHLVGDGLGVPYEFRPPSAIGEVIVGTHGTHGQPPGTWSDDGALMRILPLALAGHSVPQPALMGQAHRASALTHGHPLAQVACAWYTLTARELLPADETGVERRATEDVRGEVAEIDEAITGAVDATNFRCAAALQGLRTTVLGDELLGFLAPRNVLPRYGFPVDVVPLDLTHSWDTETSRKIELDRDLKLAISEYAPGAEVVAAKQVWVSRDLRTRPDRAGPSWNRAVCGQCGAYRQRLTELPPTCAVCGDPTSPGYGGEYVIPVFGFVSTNASRPSGDARPERMGSTEAYFGKYATDDVSTLESTVTPRPGLKRSVGPADRVGSSS